MRRGTREVVSVETAEKSAMDMKIWREREREERALLCFLKGHQKEIGWAPRS